MSPNERRQEVIDVCLKTFMANGLSHTSTKKLCDALHLNSGGVFWYFKTKEDIVIACAEEATVRIENELFGIAKNIYRCRHCPLRYLDSYTYYKLYFTY